MIVFCQKTKPMSLEGAAHLGEQDALVSRALFWYSPLESTIRLAIGSNLASELNICLLNDSLLCHIYNFEQTWQPRNPNSLTTSLHLQPIDFWFSILQIFTHPNQNHILMLHCPVSTTSISPRLCTATGRYRRLNKQNNPPITLQHDTKQSSRSLATDHREQSKVFGR